MTTRGSADPNANHIQLILFKPITTGLGFECHKQDLPWCHLGWGYGLSIRLASGPVAARVHGLSKPPSNKRLPITATATCWKKMSVKKSLIICFTDKRLKVSFTWRWRSIIPGTCQHSSWRDRRPPEDMWFLVPKQTFEGQSMVTIQVFFRLNFSCKEI